MVSELFYKNVRESLYREFEYYTTQNYLMCSKFWAPNYPNI